ncbi:sulfotransferase family protein [Bradyrhizobium ontarionense]|uniref:Sulfotransferase family protein n=1 Tax=Bradyrhizobium ontarionense TaxID=2898149 RepID=A0ABY3RBA9_9BRAD|nr:sulfotransferase family 2 domain-containing protein [Bradyrhizobium sp. A19]UFZ04091.1 sulfotransferase family protein [Bradyrhizobium sp. A19]
MMICHSHRFIFVHVPKTSGTSIKDALGQAIYGAGSAPEFLISPNPHYPPAYTASVEEHITATKLAASLPADVWDSYFKFGFVRNPFSWLVSNYFFFLRDRTDHPAHEFLKSQGFSGAVRFFLDAAKGASAVEGMHLRQSYFLCDGAGKSLVDFIGKYETLGADFHQICERVGIQPPPLPKLNQTRHRPFGDYYDETLRSLVYQGMIEDFRAFEYSSSW